MIARSDVTIRVVNTRDESWDEIDTDVREVRHAVLVVELD